MFKIITVPCMSLPFYGGSQISIAVLHTTSFKILTKTGYVAEACQHLKDLVDFETTKTIPSSTKVPISGNGFSPLSDFC